MKDYHSCCPESFKDNYKKRKEKNINAKHLLILHYPSLLGPSIHPSDLQCASKTKNNMLWSQVCQKIPLMSSLPDSLLWISLSWQIVAYQFPMMATWTQLLILRPTKLFIAHRVRGWKVFTGSSMLPQQATVIC